MDSCYSNAYIYSNEYIMSINGQNDKKIVTDSIDNNLTDNTEPKQIENFILNPRDHIIDISPHLLYSRGDMVELMIRTQTSNYLSFVSLENVFIFLDKNFEKVFEYYYNQFYLRSLVPNQMYLIVNYQCLKNVQ